MVSTISKTFSKNNLMRYLKLICNISSAVDEQQPPNIINILDSIYNSAEYNICILWENMKCICTSFRNR